LVYDCANESVARWIGRLAKKVHLTRPQFTVVVQPRAEEIAAVSPAADDADESPASSPQAAGEGDEASRSEEHRHAGGCTPRSPTSVESERPTSPPAPEPQTALSAAERERRYRQALGIPEPKPRRRWRR
jgi:hypothetical protein